MHYYEVAPTKVVRSGSDSFTYQSEDTLRVGTIVLVPVGKKLLPGIIIGTVKQPNFTTKPIERLLYDTPLPYALLRLATWISEYYATPLAVTLQSILPSGITKNRRQRIANKTDKIRERTQFVYTSEQQAAIEKIDDSTGTILLHGVTGSGKTAIYIDQIKKQLALRKDAILLVPEISLTSQLVDELSAHFDNLLVTHSRQTEAERHIAWEHCLNTSEPTVVVGPRSALFMPLKNLSLIVIDEAHEPSYQQEQNPKYSTLRVASKYAQLIAGKTIFGSATPLVSDYYLAEKNRAVVTLTSRARSTTSATVELVDMTKRGSFTKHRFLSNQLLSAMHDMLGAGEQVLLFHNRRGSASTTLCESCGWHAGCPRCIVPLTLHADIYSLTCHICGFHDRIPTSCPECGGVDILHKGIGTKQIEAEITRLFPKATIARFDKDTDHNHSVEQRYKALYDGSIDIIIGTQVIAKGLDLPKLTLVGIIQADAGLSLPDYSAAERTFQLLTQVIGRVGRNERLSRVVVQSFQPNNPVIQRGLSQDYASFYDATLQQRADAKFPPYRFLLKLTCVYKTEKTVIKHARALATTLRAEYPSGVEVLGPTPSFYERQGDTYRWQLIIKANTRAPLLEIIKNLPIVHWQYELEPISLL